MTSSSNMRANSLRNWLISIAPSLDSARMLEVSWLRAALTKIAPTLLPPIPSVPTSGTIEILGHVRGSISCNRLIVGPDAKILGDVEAHVIVLKGEVRGTVKAHQILLHKEGALVGDIVCQYFCMKEGAHFDGSMRRTVRVLPPALINAEASEEAQSSPKRPARRAKASRRPAAGTGAGKDDKSLEVLISNGVTVSFAHKPQRGDNSPSQ